MSKAQTRKPALAPAAVDVSGSRVSVTNLAKFPVGIAA